MTKGVSKVKLITDQIRGGDNTSYIVVDLLDASGRRLPSLSVEYIRLNDRDGTYYKVESFIVTQPNRIAFKPGLIPNGDYVLEIKDSNGVIYPSNNDTIVEVTKSSVTASSIRKETFSDAIKSVLDPMIDAKLSTIKPAKDTLSYEDAKALGMPEWLDEAAFQEMYDSYENEMMNDYHGALAKGMPSSLEAFLFTKVSTASTNSANAYSQVIPLVFGSEIYSDRFFEAQRNGFEGNYTQFLYDTIFKLEERIIALEEALK